MIIQKREYQKCKCCGRNEKMIQDELYGCDNCKKEIGDATKGLTDYLEITAHYQKGDSKRLHFCSWSCALTKLKKLKTDYFISLPFLSFDNKVKGQRPSDFWDAIDSFAKSK